MIVGESSKCRNDNKCDRVTQTHVEQKQIRNSYCNELNCVCRNRKKMWKKSSWTVCFSVLQTLTCDANGWSLCLSNISLRCSLAMVISTLSMFHARYLKSNKLKMSSLVHRKCYKKLSSNNYFLFFDHTVRQVYTIWHMNRHMNIWIRIGIDKSFSNLFFCFKLNQAFRLNRIFSTVSAKKVKSRSKNDERWSIVKHWRNSRLKWVKRVADTSLISVHLNEHATNRIIKLKLMIKWMNERAKNWKHDRCV